jgi:hypothetical protein
MRPPTLPFRLPAAAVAMLLASACTDGTPTAVPRAAPAAPAEASAGVTCTVDVPTARLACGAASPALPEGMSAAMLGGQGTNVSLASSGTSYDGATSTLSTNVTVQNLTAQVLGSADGVTAAPEGVRIFFSAGPSVTAGKGTVSVANADGEGTFTGAAQAFFQYAGPLAPGDTSAAKAWRFSVPVSVVSFSFTVYVAAPVPSEGGWVSVQPIAPSLLVGDTMRLSAVVHGVTGRDLGVGPVAWTTSDPSVATVDASGVVTAVDSGTATLTATSGGRTGRVKVVVDRHAGSLPRGTVVSFDVVPRTYDANGRDTARLRVVMRRYFIAEVDVTVLPPGPGQQAATCRAFGAGRLSEDDVVYECALSVPVGSRSGIWRVTHLEALFSRDVPAADLAAAGAPTFLNVRSPNEDTTRPDVTAFALSPDTVLAGSGQAVAMDVGAADTGRGVESVTVTVVSAESGPRFTFTTSQRVAGTENDGTFRCSVSLPDWVRSGMWTVVAVAARDYNGNTRTLATADLQSAGWRASFTVTNPDPDLTAPTITAFSFSPDTVAGNGVDSVRVTLSAQDARTEVWFVDMEFENADATQTRRCLLNAPPQPELTLTCAQRFTAADVGPWHVLYVRAIDTAGNSRVLWTDDLQAASYPTRLTISP